MGYVFISYSSKNSDTANNMRKLLKDKNIQTWMAPYDIPAGQRYAEVIAHAIKDCDCLLLLLTAQCQQSIWVDKELERALNYHKPIFPMRLDGCELEGSFEFYLGNQQIVDVARTDENDAGFAKILRALAAFSTISAHPDDNHRSVASPTPQQPTTAAATPASTTQSSAPVSYGAVIGTGSEGGYGAAITGTKTLQPPTQQEAPSPIGYGMIIGKHDDDDRYGRIIGETQPAAGKTDSQQSAGSADEQQPAPTGYGTIISGSAQTDGYGAPVKKP